MNPFWCQQPSSWLPHSGVPSAWCTTGYKGLLWEAHKKGSFSTADEVATGQCSGSGLPGEGTVQSYQRLEVLTLPITERLPD